MASDRAIPSDFRVVLMRWRSEPDFARAMLADRTTALAGYRLDALELARLDRLVDGSPTYDELLGPSDGSRPD